MSKQLSPLASSILEYLAQGLSQEQTARALNCSASYVSSLMDDDYFVTCLREKQASSIADEASNDSQKARIEKKLLDGIEASLPMLIDPMKRLHAFRIINSAKRHSSVHSGGTSQVNQTVVQLQLPPALLGKFTLNAQNQVIEAGGQTLVTMHPHELDAMRTKTLGVQNDSPQISTTKIDEFGFEHVSR